MNAWLKILTACCCGVVVASCSRSDVASRYVKTASVDQNQSALISVSVADSTVLAGTVLAIPKGAVTAPTTLTLELGQSSLVSDAEAAGPVAIWGPSGLVFQSEATMTLPYQLHAGQAVNDLSVMQVEADGSSSLIDGSALVVDSSRLLATFKVKGFSSFQVTTRRRPHDGGTGGGQGGGDGGTGGGQGGGDGGTHVQDGGFDPPVCNYNSECRYGESCAMGYCLPVEPVDGGFGGTDGGLACVDNSVCPDWEYCGADFNCQYVLCRSDSRCSYGQSCRAGICAPVPPVDGGACTPFSEVCNGIDDNCNGLVDENTWVVCGVGACERIVACVASPDAGNQCVPGLPTAEVCNGIDDNCDGLVDNGCVGVTDAGTGVTDGGFKTDGGTGTGGTDGGFKTDGGTGTGGTDGGFKTDGGTGDGGTDAGTKVDGGSCVPTTEVCDGVDNNCNGQVDEGTVVSCGVGACFRSVACGLADGGPPVCVPGLPTAEVCNGVDDNCDGIVGGLVLFAWHCPVAFSPEVAIRVRQWLPLALLLL